MGITNQVSIIGRLTADPEVKTTQSEVSVADVSVAVQRPYNKEKDHPEADFINCTFFGRTADFVSKYFAKGKVIGVIGRIQVDKWKDDEGKTRYATKVIGDSVDFIPGVPRDDEKDQPSKPSTKAAKPAEVEEDGGDDEYPF